MKKTLRDDCLQSENFHWLLKNNNINVTETIVKQETFSVFDTRREVVHQIDEQNENRRVENEFGF